MGAFSKTRMIEHVKALRWNDVRRGLRENPALREVRDDRGRTFLHVCCGVKIAERGLKASASIKTAQALLDAGLDIDDAAFTEKDFRATPLWYAVAHARNVVLAKCLLERGCDPNYCMWAAAYNDDVAAIRLLAAYGAPINLEAEGASPFLFAVQWNRFSAAEQLLKLGADVNYRDAKGRTALHTMLRKGSDRVHFQMIAKYRPRVDLPDREGATAYDIMSRKRDRRFRDLAERLASDA